MLGKTEPEIIAGGRIQNLLGPNTSFQGTIKSDENLRIDGVYEGRIETAGNVIVGPSAKVLAEVIADTVQVWGVVRGTIIARGRLEILPSGRVWGDVRVASLLIDEGGVYHGQCTMGEETLEPLALLEATRGILEGEASLTDGRHPRLEGSEEPAEEDLVGT